MRRGVVLLRVKITIKTVGGFVFLVLWGRAKGILLSCGCVAHLGGWEGTRQFVSFYIVSKTIVNPLPSLKIPLNFPFHTPSYIKQ